MTRPDASPSSSSASPDPIPATGFTGAVFRQRWLIAAVLAGLLMRCVFMVGLTGGFPQDDSIYIGTARQLAAGENLFDHYAHLPPDYQADPSEYFFFRATLIYPLTLVFKILGEGDRAATLVPIVYSVLSLVIVAQIATMAAGRRAGLYAAWLLALLPLDILTSSRVLVDAPLGTFLGAGVLCALRGARDRSSGWWALAGLSFGFAYLTKILALHLVLALAPVLVCLARRWRIGLAWGAAGLLLVVLTECVVYQHFTDTPFLHAFIVKSAVAKKFVENGFGRIEALPHLRFIYEGNFAFYTPILLGWAGEPPFDLGGIGWHGVLWFAAAGWFLLRRDPLPRAIAGAFVMIYLLEEILPVAAYAREDVLELVWIPRQARFICWLAPLGCAAAGCLLAKLSGRWRLLGPVLFGSVVCSALPSGWHDYQLQREQLADMRESARIITALGGPVYTDLWADHLLHYYLPRDQGIAIAQLHSLAGPEQMPRGIVLLGGERGSELSGSAVDESLPPWLLSVVRGQSVPAGWHRLLVRRDVINEVRSHDLVLYLVDRRSTR